MASLRTASLSTGSLVALLIWMTKCVSIVETKLVAATILPHGDVAYDPTHLFPGTKAREAGDEIAKGAREAAKWFATTTPTSYDDGENNINKNESRDNNKNHDRDNNGTAANYDLIFLSTPHGIQLTHDFGIYLGPKASGSINITGDNSSSPSQTVTMPPITLDTALSMDLVMELTTPSSNSNPGNSKRRRRKVFNVSGIATSADGAHDMPLEWAEIIPLKFLPEPQRHSYKYIIWSYPLRRYTESPDMVPELLELGAAIREWMEGIPQLRMGVIISGDMSHTHQSTGPYGYSNTSQPFDEAVGRWATNPCSNWKSLLVEARSLQNRAMSCGFTGMILLHGMLCGNNDDDDNDDNKNNNASPSPLHFSPLPNDRVYVNRNATYYGMMAATFDDQKFQIRQQQQQQQQHQSEEKL